MSAEHYYAYLDGLIFAIEALLDFSHKDSSVNFKAWSVLGSIRDRSDACATLIEVIEEARGIRAAQIKELKDYGF